MHTKTTYFHRAPMGNINTHKSFLLKCTPNYEHVDKINQRSSSFLYFDCLCLKMSFWTIGKIFSLKRCISVLSKTYNWPYDYR